MSETQQKVLAALKSRLHRNLYTTHPSLRQLAGQGFCDGGGLCQWAFRQGGIEIGSTLAAQFARGKAVPPQEIAPCDLLFFYGTNGKLGHVEMAMDQSTLCGIGRGVGPYLHSLPDYCGYRALRGRGLAGIRRYLEV